MDTPPPRARTLCAAGYMVTLAGDWRDVAVRGESWATCTLIVIAQGAIPLATIWIPDAPTHPPTITAAATVDVAIDRTAFTMRLTPRHVTPRHRAWPRAFGQALPLLALTLALLIAFAALAIDGALAYAARERMRLTTDMAALVGARTLLTESTAGEAGQLNAVQAAVTTYVAAQSMIYPNATTTVLINDGAGTTMQEATAADTSWPSSDMVGVTVVTRTTIDTYLLGMFGYPTLTIETRAAARFGSAGTADGADMWPFGISQAAAQQIFLAGDAGMLLDMDGQIAAANDALTCDTFDAADPLRPIGCVDDFIRQDELRMVRIGTGDVAPPPRGRGTSCASADEPESTRAYWCVGGMRDSVIRNAPPNAPRTQIAREVLGTAPSDGWPVTDGYVTPSVGKTGIVPVLVDAFDTTADAGWMTIEYFMPLRITGVQPGRGTIRVRYTEPFVIGGALAAMTNNDNHGARLCMPCVINQVKEDN